MASGCFTAKRVLPKQEPRIETGNIQFGDDWVGLFIRGDNCAGYVWDLQMILEDEKVNPIIRIRLESLLDLLKGTRVP